MKNGDNNKYFQSIYSEKYQDNWLLKCRVSQNLRFKLIKNAISNYSHLSPCIDIGTGDGYLLKTIAPDFLNNFDVVELNKNACSILSNYGFNNVICAEFPNLKIIKKYNLFTCFDSIYYLNDEYRNIALEKIYNSLEINGIFIVSISYYEKYFKPNEFKERLLSLNLDNNFKIISEKRKSFYVFHIAERIICYLNSKLGFTEQNLIFRNILLYTGKFLHYSGLARILNFIFKLKETNGVLILKKIK
tara:strand:+ start:404 stop:1141 length:738 start_codon:yes stop_codon:yes gene_type:complete